MKTALTKARHSTFLPTSKRLPAANGFGPRIAPAQNRLDSFAFPPLVQASLSLSHPDDKYEEEADRVAETVVTAPESHTWQTGNSVMPHPILPIHRISRQDRQQLHRQVEEEEKEKEKENKEEELVQTKFSDSGTMIIQREEITEEEEEKKKNEEENLIQTKMNPFQGFFTQRQENQDTEEREKKKEEEEQVVQTKSNPFGVSIIQRQETETERKKKKQEEEDEQPNVLTKRDSGRGTKLSKRLEQRIKNSLGRGSLLPEKIENFFEHRFGYDFSQVQTHSDPPAADAARQLNAKAFTIGEDIFFDSSRYQPDTLDGQKLLAHELTHVMQQQSQQLVSTNTMQKKIIPGILPFFQHDEISKNNVSKVKNNEYKIETPIIEAEVSELEQTLDTNEIEEPPRRSTRIERQISHRNVEAPSEEPSTEQDIETPSDTESREVTEQAEEPLIDTSSSSEVLQSLATIPPSSFGQAITNASQASVEIQIQERSDLEANMPEIESPTGMPRIDEQPAPQEIILEQGTVPEPESPANREEPPMETSHDDPEEPVPASQVSTIVTEPDEAEGGSWWDWLSGTVGRLLGRIPTSDPALSTSAGPRPQVDITGDADPTGNERIQQASNEEVITRRAEADQATQSDFGANGIAPTVEIELLRPSYTSETRETRQNANIREPNALPDQIRAGIDESASSYLSGEVNQRVEQEQQQRAEYERQSQEARDERRREIEEETERVRSEQLEVREEAQNEVDEHREHWQEENRRIQNDYSEQAESRRREVDEQIDSEVETAETRADSEFANAEERAERERDRTEQEAERRRREAENQPRSFWDRLKGAVSSFFDRLRRAINGLFEALRRTVRNIIEGAKRLVNGIIEGARRVIVGLIRGFGEFLKTVVTVALAAFPEVAARAREFIDGAVETAVEIVNHAAETLKEIASQILDALGAALDFILSVYQQFYDLLLHGLELLAVGLIEIMERIGHLVSAAQEMPDQFEGQFYEEILGSDLTQPLPFERSQPLEQESALTEPASTGAISSDDASILTRTTFSEDDIEVDQVVSIDDPSPEFIEFIDSLGLEEGQELEFGESNDPSRSIAAIQDEISEASVIGATESSDLEEQLEGEPESVGTTEESETQNDHIPGLDPEADLEFLMSQEPEGGCTREKTEDAATQSDVPEEMRVYGPFTTMQRARYMLNQMWKGIQQWFSCNWPWLLAAVIAALAGLIALNILTGGAITAALPIILQIVAVVLIGVAIVRMGRYFGEYLAKGWVGDITNAAKSLARGLAIGAIELIFAVLFALTGGILNAIKAAVRATLRVAVSAGRAVGRGLVTGARAVARGVSRVGKAVGRFTSRVGGAVIRRGKIVMRGLRRGFDRGIRTIDDLVSRLRNSVRFRRFSLGLRGQLIILYGHINPKVKLLQIRLARMREEIAEVIERGTVVIRESRAGRRWIDLARADRDAIAAILKRNRNLIRDVRRLREAGLVSDSILDDFLFRIEGHHAVPMWMGGPQIAYRSSELLGVARMLHNFNPSGFHSVMNSFWRNSRIFGHIAINDADAVRALFRGATASQRRLMFSELRAILTNTYTQVLKRGPALRHALEVMEEGLTLFRY